MVPLKIFWVGRRLKSKMVGSLRTYFYTPRSLWPIKSWNVFKNVEWFIWEKVRSLNGFWVSSINKSCKVTVYNSTISVTGKIHMFERHSFCLEHFISFKCPAERLQSFQFMKLNFSWLTLKCAIILEMLFEENDLVF